VECGLVLKQQFQQKFGLQITFMTILPSVGINLISCSTVHLGSKFDKGYISGNSMMGVVDKLILRRHTHSATSRSWNLPLTTSATILRRTGIDICSNMFAIFYSTWMFLI